MMTLGQEPHGVFALFFLLTFMRKMMAVFQLSLHLITMTEELISNLPVSQKGND